MFRFLMLLILAGCVGGHLGAGGDQEALRIRGLADSIFGHEFARHRSQHVVAFQTIQPLGPKSEGGLTGGDLTGFVRMQPLPVRSSAWQQRNNGDCSSPILYSARNPDKDTTPLACLRPGGAIGGRFRLLHPQSS